MRISFPHSHAFPGGRLTIEDAEDSQATCAVEFGDGITVIAACRRDGDEVHLTVPAYRTAKGSEIASREWRLAPSKDGTWRSRPLP